MSEITGYDYWSSRYAAMRSRLKEPLWWFPFPCLLAFGLNLVLSAHILFAINPRMGSPVELISFPSTTHRDSAIWLSATTIGKEIVITTNDRRVFRWPQNIRSELQMRELIDYLRQRVTEEIQTAALFQHATKNQTLAVIAADQRLKYLHIKPIVMALAKAGISNYGFETLNPVMASSNHDHGDGVHR